MIAWSFKGRENLNFSTYEKLFERSKVQDYHHGITSGMRAVTFGVSQDTILGPLLLLYTGCSET